MKVPYRYVLTLDSSQEVELEVPNDDNNEASEFLVLQGKPIDEPVAKYGPFVMNTRQEIEQAFADYQKTKFGGWPWPKYDHVFARDKGRFALMNGKESTPTEKHECAVVDDTK